MQYTIRNVPPSVDRAIRQSARRSGKSINAVALAALAEGIGAAGVGRKRRDVSDVAGTWREEGAVEAALADQDRVDPGLWR